MTKDKALKLALDFIVATNKSSGFWLVPASNLNKVVTAIKEALEQPEQEPVDNGKLQVTLQDTPTEIELAQYKRMFAAACADLGEINEALRLDPDDGGAEPILSVIAELKAQLKEPEQEPVAHFGSAYVNENGVHITTVLGPVAIPQDAKLYTTPPKRQPLTLNEMSAIEEKVYMQTIHKGKPSFEYAHALIRATEAAHGIKE